MTAIDVNGTAAVLAPYWDPYDEVLDDDPYPVWKRLRDEAPVYRNDTYDFWALSRFDDIRGGAYKDTAYLQLPPTGPCSSR